jgi:hypothetical protein
MFYFLKQNIKSKCFFIIEIRCYISWVIQKIEDYKFLGPSFLHNSFFLIVFFKVYKLCQT